MSLSTLRSPLPWLGALLGLYLVVPIVAFGARIAGSANPGFSTPGLLSALYVSVATATISTVIVAILGIPLAYLLARSHGRLATVVGCLVQLPLALPPLISGVLLIYVIGPYTTIGRAFGMTHPASAEVARLVGIQNVHPGRVVSAGVVRAGGFDLALDAGDLGPGREVLWCIRPEEVRLSEAGTYPATVTDAAVLGAVVEFVVQLDETGPELRAQASRSTVFAPGTRCGVEIPPDAVTLWAQDRPAAVRA